MSTQKEQPATGRDGSNVRRLWATSVLMQTLTPGKLNHVVGYREAVSEAAATGLAIAAAEKLNPSSQLCGVSVCEIEPAHIEQITAKYPPT